MTLPFSVPADGDLTKVRAVLREDVAKRLQHVCAGWPREEFEAVVEKVTETTIKYADSPPAVEE